MAPTPVAPKRRKGPGINLTWRDDFCATYERVGGFYAAAKTAGVNSSTVYDEIARDPAFKARVEEARQRFADAQEARLDAIGANGNPVGPIVLLKKHRPHEYIEKNLTLTATVHTELSAADGKALLQAMFGHALPSSPTPPALPDAPPR